MTIIEYTQKLGLELNQTELKILIEYSEGNEKPLVTFPKSAEKDLLVCVINRYEGYCQGRIDSIDEFLQMATERIRDDSCSCTFDAITILKTIADELKEVCK